MIFIAESETAPSFHHLFFRGCCSWVLGDINKEEELKLDSKVVNMSKEGKKESGRGGGGGSGGGRECDGAFQKCPRSPRESTLVGGG